MARGGSGGVTTLGMAATGLGALLIALVFAGTSALFARTPATILSGLVIVTAAGVFGSLVDSVLGGTIQAQYATASRDATERRSTEGSPNVLIRGLPFVTNDVVNFLSTAAGAGAGAVLSLFVR